MVLRTRCRHGQRLRGHGVSIVNYYYDYDYSDTFWKLWRLLTDFKGTIRQKKVFGCVYTSNSNNLKIWKPHHLKKNLGIRAVFDYADTGFSNFAIEYLRENEKFCETFLPVHMGPRSNLLSPKKWPKISWHCPFKGERKHKMRVKHSGWKTHSG